MKSYLFRGESDIQLIRELIKHLSYQSTIVDFEETLLLASVRATTRLWQHNNKLIGFAFVDDYNNLRFEIKTEYSSDQLQTEIVEWGIACVRKRNAETGRDDTLDSSFKVENTWQIEMLEKFGFVRESFRSLKYSRSLSEPIADYTFPQGFSLRYVEGEQEVDKLVILHCAAFGTDNMTADARIAIMRAPQYERELDFVVIAPNGELAAFCICGLEEANERIGYTDPIGTHPRYQQLGLGKAALTAGLLALKNRGANIVELRPCIFCNQSVTPPKRNGSQKSLTKRLR